MPAGDTELEVSFYGGDNFFVSHSPEGNIYIYVEEIDESDPDRMPSDGLEYAIFKVFESGEAVEGSYLGSVLEGKSAKHLYWVNAYEGVKYDAARGQLRQPVHLPEVSDSGSSDIGDSTPGSSEDV